MQHALQEKLKPSCTESTQNVPQQHGPSETSVGLGPPDMHSHSASGAMDVIAPIIEGCEAQSGMSLVTGGNASSIGRLVHPEDGPRNVVEICVRPSLCRQRFRIGPTLRLRHVHGSGATCCAAVSLASLVIAIIEPVIVLIVAWVVCLVDMDHVGDCVGMCRAGACSLHS